MHIYVYCIYVCIFCNNMYVMVFEFQHIMFQNRENTLLIYVEALRVNIFKIHFK